MNQQRAMAEQTDAFPTPIRVLLADDSPIMTRALVGLLSTFEALEVVDVVFDGQQAVDAATKLAPDLVLLDFRMPRMDGLAAAEAIREFLPQAKIILMSLHDHDSVRLAAEERADAFISKTDLRARLPEKLEELFPFLDGSREVET